MPEGQIKLTEDALRKSEQRYSAFIHNSSEAIWCFELEEPVPADWPAAQQIDAFYRLSYLAECNDAMARLYGYERAEEVRGMRLGELMPKSDPENVAYLEAFIAAGHQLINAESIEVARDGSKKYLLNSLRAVIENGAILRAWGTSRDITDRRRAEEERKRYIAEIEQLNRSLEERVRERTAALSEANEHLRDFAHTVAHDLRGPLRSMRDYAGILLEEHAPQLNEEGREMARRIQRAGDRLEALVKSVLEYSRTLSANLKFEPVATADVVAELRERHDEAIRRARAQIDIAPNLPVFIAHRPLLVQALDNLLTNALKFVPQDREPRIAIYGETRDGRPRLCMRDNGVGIDAADRERIFGIFQRVGRPQDFAGTGVGLTIVKTAVERMRGRVGVEPSDAAGSVFWIELPQPGETAG
jgi:PAS domain S-box-containing protein